jgi:hypothetical protein
MLNVSCVLVEQGLLVGQPHILEGVQIAARHAPVGRAEGLLRVDIDPLVTEVLFEYDLRQVGDRAVLVPAHAGEGKHLALPEGAAARRGENAQHEHEDNRRKFAARFRSRRLPPLPQVALSS